MSGRRAGNGAQGGREGRQKRDGGEWEGKNGKDATFTFKVLSPPVCFQIHNTDCYLSLYIA